LIGKINGARGKTPVGFAGPTIGDVNQLIEKILLKELPLKRNGIEISFDQPNREWSGRLSGPTLNLFLYDIRRNKYREGQWERLPSGKSNVMMRRPAIKIDLKYIITAWVIDGNPDEEHYLLTAALLALARHPVLPNSPDSKDIVPPEIFISSDFLPDALRYQPAPVQLLVAEPENLVNPSDVWSSLDNELRASFTCTTMLALYPYEPIEIPMVKSSEVRSRQMEGEVEDERPLYQTERAKEQGGNSPKAKRPLYAIEGHIHGDGPLENMRLVLFGQGINGRGLKIPVEANETLTDYKFDIPQLKMGDYDLRVSAYGHPPVTFRIALPTSEIEIEEQKGGISFTIKIQEH